MLLLPFSAGGQTQRASLRGTIMDPNDAVIPGASVKAINVATNESRSVISDGEGSYTISSLDPGTYRVEIERPGFKPLVIKQVDLQVNQELRLDAHLEVGEVVDSPGDLYSPEPLLKQDSAAIGTVIE